MKDTIERLIELVEEADVVELAEPTMGMVKLDKADFIRGLHNFHADSPAPYTYVCEMSERTETKFLFLTADPDYGDLPRPEAMEDAMLEDDEAEIEPEDPDPVAEAYCVKVELERVGFTVEDLDVTSPTTGTMRVVDADTGEVVLIQVHHDFYATSTLGKFWSRLNNFVELRDRLTELFSWKGRVNNG